MMTNGQIKSGGELGECPFCQSQLHLDTDDIEGWIAYVACTGCDMRGPISEWKYDDIEDAKADGLARWYAAWNARTPAKAGEDGVREADIDCLDAILDCRGDCDCMLDVIAAHRRAALHGDQEG